MKVRSSESGAIDDSNSLDTAYSTASGRSGRRGRTSRSTTSGRSGRRRRPVRSQASQKPISSDGRRSSDAIDKYQCEGDCSQTGEPPTDEPQMGEEAEAGAATRRPSHCKLEPERVDCEPPTGAKSRRPSIGSIQWPDEAVRQQAQGKRAGKHIHPCICDLSKRQRANIEHFLRDRRAAQQRYERRVQEIEEEIRLAEEAEQQRLRELDAESEFYGDEYELEGSKRKRKKRSARRASMVSLGVKQIINWHKPPKVEVRLTRTAKLRMMGSVYCKPPLPPLPEIRPVDVDFAEPELPIRSNRTVELRFKFIRSHIEAVKRQEVKFKYPNRPPFITCVLCR